MRNVTVYLVTAIVFFAFCFSKSGFTGNSFKKVNQFATAPTSSAAQRFIGNSGNSFKIFHDLLCEVKFTEEAEEEEEEEKQNSSPVTIITGTVYAGSQTSSKETVYYHQKSKYTAPPELGLYTLFCSWKSNLV